MASYIYGKLKESDVYIEPMRFESDTIIFTEDIAHCKIRMEVDKNQFATIEWVNDNLTDLSLRFERLSTDVSSHISNNDIHVMSQDKTSWNNKQDAINDLDNIRSGAALGATAIQTEVDPTVPSWAKEPNKPTYTASEVGALSADTSIPSSTSDLENDSGFITNETAQITESQVTDLTSDLTSKVSLTSNQEISGQKDFNSIPRVKVTHETHNLPSEYQEVEYIESTGTQYLNTGFTPANDNYEFDIEMSISSVPGTANGYIGYRNVSAAAVAGNMRYFFVYFDNRMAVRNGVAAENSTWMATLGLKYTISYKNKSLYQNDTRIVQSTQQSSNPTFKPFYLFGVNTDGYYSADLAKLSGKVYSCKLYNNGVLANHLIPCYRISDDEPGMYDIITNEFRTNLGTGEFQIGNNIVPYTYENLLTDANFATVAFTGSYSDLSDKPTGLSDFVNDGDYVSDASYVHTDNNYTDTAAGKVNDLGNWALADSVGGTAKLSMAIPYGEVDGTSTSTKFTATIPGITEYKNGTIVLLKNGVVTSASGFTININGLGAKPAYTNMAAATAETTVFNINYTMLFVYDESRVSGGCWICYRGYDSNTNTIGYQIRTNAATLPVSDTTGRYRLLFVSADRTKFVPSTTSTSTNATAKRDVNQRPIDPFGPIVLYSSTTVLSAGTNAGTGVLWQQYSLTLGYAFNLTGSALVLPYPSPIYIKAAPQSDGSAIIDENNPYVFSLPSTEDGNIYIFLGITYSATQIELRLEHPVYYYKDGAVRRWTNAPQGLPAVTSDDNGKILKVVNGVWALVNA